LKDRTTSSPPVQTMSAGPDDVEPDRDRDHRVEPVQAGEQHQAQTRQHAERRPHVGHQVLAVGLQHDRAVLAAVVQQHARRDEVHRRRRQPDQCAEFQVAQRLGAEEPADGVSGGAEPREDDEDPFEAAGEVLDLLVTERVAAVGRSRRVPQRDVGGDRRRQVHETFERVGEQPDRAGHGVGGPLHADRDQRGDDRQRDRPAEV
jgi:hypothetical protein